MDVHVRMPIGSIDCFTVNHNTTVSQLKQIIGEQHSMSAPLFELRCEGVRMKPSSCLTDYSVEQGEIELLPSKRGLAIKHLGFKPRHVDFVFYLQQTPIPTTAKVRSFLDAGCSVSTKHPSTGKLPLHYAAAKGLVSICVMLLDDPNININATDNNEDVALDDAFTALSSILPKPSPDHITTIRLLMSIPDIDINSVILKYFRLFESHFQ